MSHIVKSCPLTKLNGVLSRLHSADEDAVSLLTSYSSWNACEKKKNAVMFVTRLRCFTRTSLGHYWENGNSCHPAFVVVRQWYWVHGIKFARWQHPAVRHGVRIAAAASVVDYCIFICYVVHHCVCSWWQWSAMTMPTSSGSGICRRRTKSTLKLMSQY